MLHGILYLRFNELVVTQCVGFRSFQFLYFSLLSFKNLVEDEGLPLEPLNLWLKSSYIIIIANLTLSFNRFIPKKDQLFLYFGHVSFICRFEIFLVILKYFFKSGVDLINIVVESNDGPFVILQLILFISQIRKEYWFISILTDLIDPDGDSLRAVLQA